MSRKGLSPFLAEGTGDVPPFFPTTYVGGRVGATTFATAKRQRPPRAPMHLITDPWHFEFMQRAFIVATLAAVVCAVVGVYVVLKGLAFMGDAIAHSSLAGMAASFALGGSVLWGAIAWVAPASLAITYLSRRARLLLDTTIGIIYAAGFALGLVIISRQDSYATDLFSFLFGNVLGVSWTDVAIVAAVAAAILAIIAALYKELLFATYDGAMAAASGIPVRAMEYLLPLLIGFTAVASLKTVGIVLVLALLVTPAATARLLARRLPAMVLVSVLAAWAAVIAGLYLSYHLDLPSGPAIVLVSTAIFLAALLLSPSRGLLRRRPGISIPVP
ncbi:MAG: metal ABC transporter permease [Dehalococcoidia bacterium]|nr:metal ABC transporter permease [Dehalococcoidia bacterium]